MVAQAYPAITVKNIKGINLSGSAHFDNPVITHRPNLSVSIQLVTRRQCPEPADPLDFMVHIVYRCLIEQ